MTIGYKTTLSIDGTILANLTNVTPPSQSADNIDVTNSDSPDQYREFEKGLIDGGEVSVEGIFKTANATAMAEEMAKDENSDYVVTLPKNLGTFTFTGFCTEYSPEAPQDDSITFSATFKVSGKPVFAPGA